MHYISGVINLSRVKENYGQTTNYVILILLGKKKDNVSSIMFTLFSYVLRSQFYEFIGRIRTGQDEKSTLLSYNPIFVNE